MFVYGDKNLGPCILECNLYISRGFSEHLGNERNYKRLSTIRVANHQQILQYKFRGWLNKSRERLHWENSVEYQCISAAELTFLK